MLFIPVRLLKTKSDGEGIKQLCPPLPLVSANRGIQIGNMAQAVRAFPSLPLPDKWSRGQRVT